MTDDLLTTGDVAEIFDVTQETVRRWAELGRIRHIRLPSGQIRFERSDVDAARRPVEPTSAA